MKTPERLSRATETLARAGREAALFARRASARYMGRSSASPARAGRLGPQAFTASLAARRHRLAHQGALTATGPEIAGLMGSLRAASAFLTDHAAPPRTRTRQAGRPGHSPKRRMAPPTDRVFLTSGAARSLITHTPLADAIASALPSTLQSALGLAAAAGRRGQPGQIPVRTRLTLRSEGQDIGDGPSIPTITRTQAGRPFPAVVHPRAAVGPFTPALRPREEAPDRLPFGQAPDGNVGTDRAQASATPERASKPLGYAGLGPSLLRETLVREGGSGSSLDHALRSKLSSHLRFDLGVARLHRGVAAGAAARELKAQAFTIGRDVFFGESRYNPSSREGLGLLAHELTHVGQQTRGIREGMHFFTPSGGGALEEEARQTAGQVLARIAPPREAPDEIGMAVPNRAAPAMTFAMREISPGTTQSAHTTTQATSAPRAAPAPQKPDPHVVTDRVYDLMKKELARDRRRGVFAT